MLKSKFKIVTQIYKNVIQTDKIIPDKVEHVKISEKVLLSQLVRDESCLEFFFCRELQQQQNHIKLNARVTKNRKILFEKNTFDFY